MSFNDTTDGRTNDDSTGSLTTTDIDALKNILIPRGIPGEFFSISESSREDNNLRIERTKPLTGHEFAAANWNRLVVKNSLFTPENGSGYKISIAEIEFIKHLSEKVSTLPIAGLRSYFIDHGIPANTIEITVSETPPVTDETSTEMTITTAPYLQHENTLEGVQFSEAIEDSKFTTETRKTSISVADARTILQNYYHLD
jgi:hypothetical protein